MYTYFDTYNAKCSEINHDYNIYINIFANVFIACVIVFIACVIVFIACVIVFIAIIYFD